MIAYYASLWLVSLLNLAWCCLQVGFVLILFESLYVKIATLCAVGWYRCAHRIGFYLNV